MSKTNCLNRGQTKNRRHACKKYQTLKTRTLGSSTCSFAHQFIPVWHGKVPRGEKGKKHGENQTSTKGATNGQKVATNWILEGVLQYFSILEHPTEVPSPKNPLSGTSHLCVGRRCASFRGGISRLNDKRGRLTGNKGISLKNGVQSWVSFASKVLGAALTYVPALSGKSQRVKTQRVKTSENFAEEKKGSQKIFQKIFQKIEDISFAGFYSISGYLRNLRGRLLSSEKLSEVFALWGGFLPFPNR